MHNAIILFYTPKSYHLYSTFHTHTLIYLTQRHPIPSRIKSPRRHTKTFSHHIPKHNHIICILFTFRQLCISYQHQLASIATPQKALTVIVVGTGWELARAPSKSQFADRTTATVAATVTLLPKSNGAFAATDPLPSLVQAITFPWAFLFAKHTASKTRYKRKKTNNSYTKTPGHCLIPASICKTSAHRRSWQEIPCVSNCHACIRPSLRHPDVATNVCHPSCSNPLLSPAIRSCWTQSSRSVTASSFQQAP